MHLSDCGVCSRAVWIRTAAIRGGGHACHTRGEGARPGPWGLATDRLRLPAEMLETLLVLDRPVVVFDTETTGTNARSRPHRRDRLREGPPGRAPRDAGSGASIPDADPRRLRRRSTGSATRTSRGLPAFRGDRGRARRVSGRMRPGRLQHRRLRPSRAANRVSPRRNRVRRRASAVSSTRSGSSSPTSRATSPPPRASTARRSTPGPTERSPTRR